MTASMPSIKVIVNIIKADSNSVSSVNYDLKLGKVLDNIKELDTTSYYYIRCFRASGLIGISL